MWSLFLATAFAFDHNHAEFATFLSGAVKPSGVNYTTLKARTDVLDRYLAQVAEADPSSFSSSEKLAFYVNAYNAYTLKTMLTAGPPASIRDLDGGKVWSTRTFRVGKVDMTLDQMEHGQARKLADGRVHAVVNCASKGCPPLPAEPLRASTAQAQLDAAAAVWAKTNAFRIDGTTVSLSRVFDWFGDDFAAVKGERDLPGIAGKEEQAVWFLARHVDAATREKLLAVTGAGWADYDWALNKSP
jgi:hypothetical protein